MAIERVMIAGGGTGGHLFPGLAVVEELRRRIPGVQVRFVGTANGIEARVLPERGEDLELIEVTPLKGRSGADLFASLTRLPRAAGQAYGVLSRFRPDLVVGVGGYASGPILVAAASRGIPTAILEQNAEVGLTNRLLGPIAGRAYVAFDDAAQQLGRDKARLLGNPVRRAFVDASRVALADPEGVEARARTVLILGGSQGAKALNERVPDAMQRLALADRGYRVLHQTGSAMAPEVRATYESLGVPAEVTPFVDDMARAYQSAALVIARAGATTLAELCAVGRPAILVPYPFAASDHQAKNADSLARDGAAVTIRQSELTVDRLVESADRLLSNRDARIAMADAARRHGRPDAAAAIVDDLVAWLGASGVAHGGGGREPHRSDPKGTPRMALRRSSPPPPVYLVPIA